MSYGIGARIRNKRIELGLTQDELAKRMGYTSRAAICKVESGQDNITSDRISKFAKALGVTESYLMGWDDEEIKKVSQQVIAFTQYEEDKKSIAAEIVESNTLYDIKRLQKYYNAMHDLTDDEMNQVVEYAMFLKQRRKE